MKNKKLNVGKMQQKNYERKRGRWIVDKAIEKLKQKIPDIVKAISTAKDFGDLSENFEYHAARAERAKMESDLAKLIEYQSNIEIIDIKKANRDRVSVCATVQLVNIEDKTADKKVYTIVGQYEVDADKYLISYLSPIGRALLGKQVGEIVELPPNSEEPLCYKIIKIDYEECLEELESVCAEITKEINE